MGDRARTPTLTALLCLGLCRGPCDQVQAGAAPKPSIWADPGPMVSRGSPMTIWCQGSLQADVYHLYKDRVSKPLDTEAPQNSSKKAGFSIESMSTHTAGVYQCAYHSRRKGWSERSDPLLLVVTGVYPAPSLSAHPSHVVTSGGNVSLSCSSEVTGDTFYLLKEGGAGPPRQMQSRTFRGRWQAVFSVGPMNASHGGTYRCYYNSSSYPHTWSYPSNPLHLEVTGVYREPSLSAQPGSLVFSGDNLTLQCRSGAGFDRFALTKDEGLTSPQHLHGQHSPYFPLGHVSHTHGGQYRCYSGHNLSHAWSAPSDPLDILIVAPSPQDYTVENLIRMGGAALILVVLGILLFQARDSPGRLEDAARRSSYRAVPTEWCSSQNRSLFMHSFTEDVPAVGKTNSRNISRGAQDLV
nr:leukocyte immunoglobulin-like receptor subfamily A member 6 isoform X7 [Equus caballus]